MGIQASEVIGLRMVKFAGGGPAAAAEAQLMFAEKIDAVWELQRLAASGAFGADPEGATARQMRHVSKKIRANRRRLSR